MAITFVQFNHGDSNGNANPFTITSTNAFTGGSGHRYVALVFWFSTTLDITGFSDNVNGSYTKVGSTFTGAAMGGRGAIYEFINPAGTASGKTFSAAFGGSVPFATIHVLEYSGCSTSASSYGQGGTNGNGASPGTVSLTATTAGDMGVAALYPNNDDATGGATGCTQRSSNTPNNGSNAVERSLSTTSATAVGSTFTSATETYVVVGAIIPQPATTLGEFLPNTELTPRTVGRAAGMQGDAPLDATVPSGVHEFLAQADTLYPRARGAVLIETASPLDALATTAVLGTLPSVDAPFASARRPSSVDSAGPLDAAAVPLASTYLANWGETLPPVRVSSTVYVELAGAASSAGNYVGEYLTWAENASAQTRSAKVAETVAPLSVVSTSPTTTSFGGWDTATSFPTRLRANFPGDAYVGTSLGWSPEPFLTWSPDTLPNPKPAAKAFPPDPYVGTSIGWAPVAFQTWTTDLAQSARRPRYGTDDSVLPSLRSLTLATYLAWVEPSPLTVRQRVVPDGNGPLDVLASTPTLLGFVASPDVGQQVHRPQPSETAAPIDAYVAPVLAGYLTWSIEGQRGRGPVPAAETPFLGASAAVVPVDAFISWSPDPTALRPTTRAVMDAMAFGPLDFIAFGRSIDWAQDLARRARAVQPYDATAGAFWDAAAPVLASWLDPGDSPRQGRAAVHVDSSLWPLGAPATVPLATWIDSVDAPRRAPASRPAPDDRQAPSSLVLPSFLPFFSATEPYPPLRRIQPFDQPQILWATPTRPILPASGVITLASTFAGSVALQETFGSPLDVDASARGDVKVSKS